MADALIRSVTGTVTDESVAGAGGGQLWGLAVSGSLSTAAIVRVYDGSGSANVVIAQIETNPVGNGASNTFETYKSVMFPRPIRFSRALGVTATAGVARYWLYLGGPGGST